MSAVTSRIARCVARASASPGAPSPASAASFASRQTRPRWRCAASAPAAVHSTSRSGGLSREHEPARGVGAVAGDDVVGIDHVLLRLRHLGRRPDRHRRPVGEPRARLVANHRARLVPHRAAVLERRIGLVRHHPLGEQRVERLDRLRRQMPGPHHRPGEEPRVEQVQDRVLDAADVLVDVHPVVGVGEVGRRRGVRRGEAREVPARVRRRCPSCRSRAAPAPPQRGQVARVQVGCHSSGLPGWSKLTSSGSRTGRFSRASGTTPQAGAVQHRDRAAPVALPRDPPVAQPELDDALADAARLAEVDRAPRPPPRRSSARGAGDRAQVVDRLGLRRHEGDVLDARLRVARHEDVDHRQAVLAARSRGRAGRAPGSRRSRRCRSPSG